MQLLIDFTIEYLKKNTSHKKVINNQELDELLQVSLGCNPIGDGGIRNIIHQIRTKHTIQTEEGNKGWVCASNEGYYVTYNPYLILKHLEQFEGKIKKMVHVHRKGMSLLTEKLYFKQLEMDFKS